MCCVCKLDLNAVDNLGVILVFNELCCGAGLPLLFFTPTSVFWVRLSV